MDLLEQDHGTVSALRITPSQERSRVVEKPLQAGFRLMRPPTVREPEPQLAGDGERDLLPRGEQVVVPGRERPGPERLPIRNPDERGLYATNRAGLADHASQK